MAREPKVKEPANLIAQNIESAERRFAQAIAEAGDISVEDADRVSVFYRRRFVAWINDRATEILPRDKSIMKRESIREALRIIRARD